MVQLHNNENEQTTATYIMKRNLTMLNEGRQIQKNTFHMIHL